MTGCLHGCVWCYARAMSKRFGGDFKPRFHAERLGQPQERKKPSKIFVCSMGELFGWWISEDWIRSVLSVIRQCDQHTFQILTKNPAHLQHFNPWPDNCWVGFSATDQRMMNEGIEYMRDVQAAVRFVSCEPMLGSIRLRGLAAKEILHWLIIGAQTGPHAITPPSEFINNLITDSKRHGIPVFLKSNLDWPRKIQEYARPKW